MVFILHAFCNLFEEPSCAWILEYLHQINLPFNSTIHELSRVVWHFQAGFEARTVHRLSCNWPSYLPWTVWPQLPKECCCSASEQTLFLRPSRAHTKINRWPISTNIICFFCCKYRKRAIKLTQTVWGQGCNRQDDITATWQKIKKIIVPRTI